MLNINDTKTRISECFKRLLSKKPLSKITVSEIINDCEINRKTFYYHFEDIYALLIWTLQKETVTIVSEFDTFTQTDEIICFALNYIEKNNAFLKNMYYSVGKDDLSRYFFNDIAEIVSKLFKMNLENIDNIDYKNFLIKFYTEGIIGILHNWMIDYPNADKNKTAKYITELLNDLSEIYSR